MMTTMATMMGTQTSTLTPRQAHDDPGCPGRRQHRGCGHKVRHPFLTRVTCYLRSGGSTNALQTPRDPSLSLTVATTSPAGGSQAHPSCSHGTLGSEAVGFLTLVPRSSSRADLPAGQQQALRPGMRLRGEWGQLQMHPWASRRQSLEETGGAGARLPSTQAGPRWPKGQGRAGPG